jgi:branched-chain amino acid transport system ATP-binding protein
MKLLEVDGVVGGYGSVPVLHGVSLTIGEGELLTMLGANGAGKSTLMRIIGGIHRPMDGKITFAGREITKSSPAQITRAGIAHVPENRRVFTDHVVEENLMLGAYARTRDRKAVRDDLERLLEKFPILRERRRQVAGSLSGGEQQMLAIAMALMARPKLLMLDEPSLGLAPIIVNRVFDEIETLRKEGTTILLNEQLATRALAVADRGIVLHLGRIVAEGTAAELQANDAVRSAYLGA